MKYRVISVSAEPKSTGLDLYEWFSGVTDEATLDPAEIKVDETDLMAVVLAQDNYDKAIELGHKLCHAGVLTLGVFPEYIETHGCFDAQAINDGKSTLGIVRALTAPAIYSGPINFDFNDINETLKKSGRFHARFVYGSDVDSLIAIVADKFNQIDLSKVESVCINLYGELQSEFKNDATDKIKALISMMPGESSVHFGVHPLPDSFTYIPDEMKHEMSFGISFILAGKNMKI